MTIRPADQGDLPAIIDLLRASLGEKLTPKSEALWRWKHQANPFGKSPVLLAEDAGELVGVRAFLRWEFEHRGKTIRACRAVDTATHPDFQGKGIFSRLTTKLVEQVSGEGVHVIFNTPNVKSAPGYLKMGWKEWGKLPLRISPHLNARSGSKDSVDWKSIATLIQNLENQEKCSPKIRTRLVPGYIRWRYQDIPLADYKFLSDGESYLLVYRIKAGKLGREFRLCDIFTTHDLREQQSKDLGRLLGMEIRSSGARFSSSSGLAPQIGKSLPTGLVTLPFGPLVTIRELSSGEAILDQDWGWTLGDLEVF
ncbi:GNAT family N-acetyltransferase [Algoriphagus sp. H41]|uniref:GNAT family N-acetyltransferase n=1 Tax=Algoriphagus oliviformis TaxID=2811231 RepID=A0ABS3C900_9BACT|nr:GNAT family N-acetyltransferase [Algoriphagus oliviformis]MBN7813044.1 GNAT family N-acetyltransferase [Algoriphagus oliviformis]